MCACFEGMLLSMCEKLTIEKAEGISLLSYKSVQKLTVQDTNVKIQIGTAVMPLCSFLKL